MPALIRREFITLVGGTAAAWPLAARAQQGERRIGVLMNLPADDLDGQARNAAFLQGLQQFGWTIGSNVRIDIRWGGGDANRMRKEAGELVASAPDVIVAFGTTSLRPLLQATRSLPVVFANVADPVGAGFWGAGSVSVSRNDPRRCTWPAHWAGFQWFG